jgi:nicotinamidase/pyrazinamidase
MSTVFLDIDTQIDFLYPAGALYVPGAEAIVDRVAALNRWAAAHGVPVISTMDAHAEDDPEFAAWPPHCVAGTPGQHKPAATLLEKRTVIPNSVRDLAIEGVQQFLLEKQSTDCFTAVNLGPLLERLGATRAVVYGVVTEICVRHAAVGLLRWGLSVELVSDAVRSLSEEAREKFLAEFQAAGGKLTTVDRITGTGTTGGTGRPGAA